MSPQTIRRLDYWLGVPACWLLTLVRTAGRGLSRCLARLPGFGRGRRRPADPADPAALSVRRILFIKMIEQGATVLAYAAIRRAVEMVGRENVYFWAFEENRPVLDLLDVIPPQNVLTIGSGGLVGFAADVFDGLLAIRRLGIDATVDMEFFARAPAVLAFLTGARRRVGLHRYTSEAPYRGDLLTHRVQYNPHLHTAAAYYVLVESLLQDPAECPMPKRPAPALPDFDPTPPQFQPTAVETLGVAAELTAAAGRPVGRPVVLLNPIAGDMLPIRRWPAERFVELGRRLLADDPDLTVVVTGGRSEQEAAEAIARRIGPPDRAISMAGRTTLRELFTLYTLADVLVTNDSGPGHFASMTRIRSLVLFGPETPRLFGPLGSRARAMTAGLACSPCVTAMNHRFSPCADNVCMQAISVEHVYAAVRAVLSEARGGGGRDADRRGGNRPLPVLRFFPPVRRAVLQPAVADLASAATASGG